MRVDAGRIYTYAVPQRILTAYETVSNQGFELVPGPPGRDWMGANHGHANRCLPLLIANQAGWLINCPATVRVKWDGNPGLDAVDIQRWQSADKEHDGATYMWPSSQFGSGIITWTPTFLFRTPPGYNLLVRGPANSVKDGIAALEGIVETDWTPAAFTMNWKITRPDTWITFETGEPICMIVPQRRGELEEFVPEVRTISENPELETSYAQWRRSRAQFNKTRQIPHSAAAKQGWEKHYVQGTSPDGLVAPEHQTRLHLRQFTHHDTPQQ